MSILVLGGAGYIGSHTALELIRTGESVIIADNLATGHIEAVPKDATPAIESVFGFPKNTLPGIAEKMSRHRSSNKPERNRFFSQYFSIYLKPYPTGNNFRTKGLISCFKARN